MVLRARFSKGRQHVDEDDSVYGKGLSAGDASDLQTSKAKGLDVTRRRLAEVSVSDNCDDASPAERAVPCSRHTKWSKV